MLSGFVFELESLAMVMLGGLRMCGPLFSLPRLFYPRF